MAVEPVDYTYYRSSVPENVPKGTVIAELALAEPQDGDVTYTIAAGFYTWLENEIPTDAFKLVGNKIVTNKALDYEYLQGNELHIEIKIRAYVDGEWVKSESGFGENILTLKVTDVMEIIKGTSKADVIKGAGGSDKIIAGAGDDKLYGYDGNDVLYGGLGKDTLYGGDGADTFLFKSIKESTVKAPDTIADWDHAKGNPMRDVIDLRAIDANTKLSGHQDFDWIGAKKFSGHAGELRYEKLKHDTYVYADVNGDGKADFAIHFNKSIKIYMDDFLL